MKFALPSPQQLRTLGLDLLAPPRCAFCASPCDSRLCCRRCLALLPRNAHACERCANPLRSSQPAGVSCSQCQEHAPLFTCARAPLLYEFPINTAVKAWKFHGHLFYLPVFGRILSEAAGDAAMSFDAIVPVPLHRRRQASRGFNQAMELAKIVSRKLCQPLCSNVLRTRATKTQSDLMADERVKNVRGAFAVAGRLACRRPLIIDDVMTTGATCNALAAALRDAGADEVYVLTIARARAPA